MISFLIVTYNKEIKDSLSYKSIIKYINNNNIIVFDNSNDKFIKMNKDYSAKNNITYYTLNKNVGLSKAYNYVVKRINKNKNHYLVILDDDTALTSEYFKELITLTKKAEYDIYLPIIYSRKMIMSPAKVQFNCRIKVIKDVKEVNDNNISAINSAMVIRTSVFNKVLYNENLFLEYIDHDFMKKIRENKYKCYIMNSIIQQKYSRFENKNKQSEIVRFKIYLKDFKKYCENCNNMPFYYISTIKYRLREILKFKDFQFLYLK